MQQRRVERAVTNPSKFQLYFSFKHFRITPSFPIIKKKKTFLFLQTSRQIGKRILYQQEIMVQNNLVSKTIHPDAPSHLFRNKIKISDVLSDVSRHGLNMKYKPKPAPSAEIAKEYQTRCYSQHIDTILKKQKKKKEKRKIKWKQKSIANSNCPDSREAVQFESDQSPEFWRTVQSTSVSPSCTPRCRQ